MSRLKAQQDGSEYGKQLPVATQHLLHKFEVALIAMAALRTRPYASAPSFIDQLLIEKHCRFF